MERHRRTEPRRAAVRGVAANLVLGALVLAAATPLRLPRLAPETSVAPPGTRATWVWQRGGGEAGALVRWARTNGVRAIFAFYQRTISDPAFAERLTRQIQQTCGTPR
ncbi:hypothetical protein KZZ52_12290 [Dactylosporangium sp. AC04546]|uniref:hypothetical protein n=1 Tax=Dactylosporangium sp. AC04546 TaxID=2862460 RepID=UPI001EDDB2D8|nr:hypothetical protein [Dactylosporangium sp. AC04546]WVK86119.1 hypothetical protein KZZ52_12290 [Dactylosporangium sp. AC04546]